MVISNFIVSNDFICSLLLQMGANANSSFIYMSCLDVCAGELESVTRRFFFPAPSVR